MAGPKKPWEEDDEPPARPGHAGAPSIPLPPTTGIGRKAPWEEEAEEARRKTGTYPPHSGEPQPMTSSSFLPMAYDRYNKPFFDINAGITGDIGRGWRALEKTIVHGEDPTTPEAVRDIYGGMKVITGPAGASRGLGVAARAMPRAGQSGALTALPGATPAPGFGARNMTGLTDVPTSAPNLFYGGSRQAPVSPTPQEARAAGSAVYEDLGNRGIDYSPAAAARWAEAMKQRLMTRQNETRARETHSVLDQLRTVPQGAVAVPFALMHDARKTLSDIRRQTVDGKATPDALAAGRALRGLDMFMGRNAVGDLAPGSSSARTVGPRMAEANANYAAGERGHALANVDRAATLQTSGANSGANLDNTWRQKLRQHLMAGGGKRVMGWNDEELAAAEKSVGGGFVRNAARTAGNIVGGGRGLGALGTAAAGWTLGQHFGGDLGGYVGAAGLPLLGFGLKGIENRIARNSMDAVQGQIMQRSPLFQERAAAAARNPSFADPVAEAFNVRAVRDKARALAPTNAVGQSLPAGPQPTQDPAWLTEEIKRRIATGQVI